ncbi:MAG: hypothetical protein R3263_01785 [Myxococcota bacterium]|nr:hypothetical protein [Myxococcota bacterium]
MSGGTARRYRAAMGRRATLVLLALAATACVPSPGPFRLAAASGRVVDADTGAPVPDALVLEWYRGGGLSDAARPVYHSRWTWADADGRFAFGDGVAPSPRMWLLKTYGPSYDVYHPAYGLVRGPTAPEGSVVLRASRGRAQAARGDLAPFCRGEREGRAARKLVEVACPPRPERPPDR